MNAQLENVDMDLWLSNKLDELLPTKLQAIENARTPSMAIIATKGTLDWAYPPLYSGLDGLGIGLGQLNIFHLLWIAAAEKGS